MNPMRAIGIITLIVSIIGAAYYLSGQLTRTQEPRDINFELQIREKKIVTGTGVLKARVGDTVTITIVSDEADEFHVHGYDRSVDLVPGVPAALSFVADASGRFEFELEKSKTDLGALEVQP